jgi:hypothetical protein
MKNEEKKRAADHIVRMIEVSAKLGANLTLSKENVIQLDGYIKDLQNAALSLTMKIQETSEISQ